MTKADGAEAAVTWGITRGTAMARASNRMERVMPSTIVAAAKEYRAMKDGKRGKGEPWVQASSA
jgi:hypothetical protein